MAEAEPEGPPRRRRRRWLWLVVGLLLALAVALRAAAPWAIARAIEGGVQDATGLPAEVANVDLGLLRGAVVAEGIVVQRPPASPGASPLLRLGRLAARLSFADLFAGRVGLRDVAIEEPVLRLLRLADGSIEVPLPSRPAEGAAERPPAEGSGRSLRIERLRVTGLDLELADPGPDAPALGFSLEELALSDVGLDGDDLTLGAVGVRGPRLRVERDFVLAPRAAATAIAEQAAPTSAAAPGPRYRLERLAVERAEISLLTESGPLDLTLDLTADGVSARAGETFPVTLELGVEGGEVRAEGHAGLTPPSFDGTLRWRDLPVPLFVVAARPDLLPWVRSCRAEGELAVRTRLESGGAPEEAAGVRVSGRFAVRDFAIGDPEEQEVELRWRALEVDVREALVPLAGEATPIRVALGKVNLADPVVRYARPTPALDALLGLAPPAGETTGGASESVAALAPAAAVEPEAAPTAEPGAASAAALLTIDSLEVSGGSVGFADGTLQAPFRTALSNLALSGRELRWPELRVRAVQLRGLAPERAPFTLSGSLDGGRGEFAFEVQRLALPALDPYATSAGYKLTRGEASVRTSLRIEPERYVADNDLLLHDLRLDALDDGAFERQFGTSLDLTLALLRRPSGDIRLPLPLTLERESLRFGRGEVVRGALRAALLGVLSSPLKALGAALPRGGESEIDAAALAAIPGSAELAPEEAARVKALGKLLRTRPLLAVSLRGRSGPEDRPALAEGLLREHAAGGEALPEVEGSGFFAARRVAEALRSDTTGALAPEDGALLARMIAATEPPPERFASLARARADGLRERLVGGKRPVDAGRITVSETGEEGTPGVALELVARTEEVLP